MVANMGDLGLFVYFIDIIFIRNLKKQNIIHPEQGRESKQAKHDGGVVGGKVGKVTT